MAVVTLAFAPPTDPDITFLHIWESATVDGSYQEIDSVSAGVYPAYIRRFTTTKALDASDWFSIQWETSAGQKSPLSAPIKGGTTTLVGEIVDRVLLREPGLDENIVIEEAESTISYVYGVSDPYLIDPTTASRLWLTELANLTLVATLYISTLITSTASSSYTAGMVSESSSTGSGGPTAILQSLKTIEQRALKRLGIGGSLVASIDKRPSGWTFSGIKTTFDSSRLLEARAIITESIIVRDLDTGLVLTDREDTYAS